MGLETVNQQSMEEARHTFMQCCTSSAWVERMAASRPYMGAESLFKIADRHWAELGESDFLEAFEGHPKIGDVNSLRAKYANTKALAGAEQSGVNVATDETLKALADGNTAYEEKFGFIFIVCATGKSAEEMLELLNQRLPNDRDTELRNAAEEQRKITRIRLEKLV
ncbi:OHCU decarboxylase [Hahella sp. CCB-MM4]|uniref:2-oxo-4-hydroxy-4-carboxy-5-ureidoimidazoline decarboxylase n=1 Tax=Hahella sp. (strain CCB-MM4) TaxID=1926491 RepID=UPI000B9AE8B1|nr:2-oxo-4-hydroxy-4-carboxy-5-ureidoimidazoline decarboxylase [Hahella sp. CCB-MM4]OZG70136.1 OHCU decarboxylase [Hahella sp. CCB-MM4]